MTRMVRRETRKIVSQKSREDKISRVGMIKCQKQQGSQEGWRWNRDPETWPRKGHYRSQEKLQGSENICTKANLQNSSRLHTTIENLSILEWLVLQYNKNALGLSLFPNATKTSIQRFWVQYHIVIKAISSKSRQPLESGFHPYTLEPL